MKMLSYGCRQQTCLQHFERLLVRRQEKEANISTQRSHATTVDSVQGCRLTDIAQFRFSLLFSFHSPLPMESAPLNSIYFLPHCKFLSDRAYFLKKKSVNSFFLL
jgi:hypothetical protein